MPLVTDTDSTDSPQLTNRSLIVEVALVLAVQTALVVLVAHVAPLLRMTGSVQAFTGVVFILLPVLVLDARGKPYRRYGMYVHNPLRRTPLLLGVMVLTFTPIAVFVLLFPQIWGLQEVSWQLRFSPGFSSFVLSQFIAVALPEEFFYRGYLQGRFDDVLKGRINLLGVRVGWGLLLTSAAFAIGHLVVSFEAARLLVFFPALLFGWLRYKTGSIIIPILFHGCSNVFMYVFRTGLGL